MSDPAGGRYDDTIKDQVQQASDIVEIVSQYIPLKKSGQNFKACCPFHQEKTPSFMVHPGKQIFHCFGCGVGGDVFSFVMLHDHTSFPEALRFLAERAHIRLPERITRRDEKTASEQEKIVEIYQTASDFYHSQFLHPAAGQTARDYFYKRSYDEALAKEMKMGWAPEGWRNLFDHLSKKGYPENLLLKSALIHRSPKGTYYDVFRSRILFPIRNLQGKIVAFGGRILSEKEEGPKYLNSPENPVFQKRKELFGLYLAKKFVDRVRPQILIVEGYFDCLKLYQAGFKAVVATLGTSLTSEHVQVLKRFAEEAVVVYDGDKAGEAASLRGLEVFLEGGMTVKLVRMPQGYDPDDFVVKQGPEAFRKILEEASDFFDFKLETLLRSHNRWDNLGLMKITGDFLETLTKVKNPILLDRYLKRLAGSLGIDENSLRSELHKLTTRMKAAPAAEPVAAKGVSPKGSYEDEVTLLFLLAEDPAYREMLLSELADSDFLDPKCQRAFQLIGELDQQNLNLDWSMILNRLEDETLKSKLIAIASLEWSDTEKAKAFQDCLSKIKAKKISQNLEALRRSIAQAEREGDQERLATYLKQYQELLGRAKKS